MNFFKNKNTRVLILVVGALAISGIAASKFFSGQQIRFMDPRVSPANELYEKYNEFAAAGQYDSVFVLMDAIEKIYRQYAHYKASYEVGVLYNNRAATYIAMALKPGLDPLGKDSLLNLAQIHAYTSINIYTAWINTWGILTAQEIRQKIQPHFGPGEVAFRQKNVERFLDKRAKQIMDAQTETPRRLSVAKTNLGIVLRHKDMLDDAVQSYLQALELWPDNLAAENNLNVIFGKPVRQRSIFRMIFPKDRI